MALQQKHINLASIIFIATVLVVQVLGQDTTVELADGNKPLDVYFLADNTGSMEDEITMVASRARFLFEQLALSTTENIRFGVGAYRDFGDEQVFQNFLNLTEENLDVPIEKDLIIQSMNSWSASGGGDDPEGQLYALYQIATSFYKQIGWRGDAVKIIVWFGDAPGHDPSGTFDLGGVQVAITEEEVIQALISSDIRVSAIDVDNLDSLGQASRISAQTGGSYAFYSRDQTEFESIASEDVEGSYYFSESIIMSTSKPIIQPMTVAGSSYSDVPASPTSFVAVDRLSDGSGNTTGLIDTIISSVEEIFLFG